MIRLVAACGAPAAHDRVSPFTVSRELGHGSRAMVEEVYAHLGTMRHRSEVVEYRIEQHTAALGAGDLDFPKGSSVTLGVRGTG
ncbi:MAG: hypothetical protein H0T86_08240 [Gemmatimonadales bacterium]|nr:hypothetical protein [Gemmatimonadales bacterium]